MRVEGKEYPCCFIAFVHACALGDAQQVRASSANQFLNGSQCGKVLSWTFSWRPKDPKEGAPGKGLPARKSKAREREREERSSAQGAPSCPGTVPQRGRPGSHAGFSARRCPRAWRHLGFQRPSPLSAPGRALNRPVGT